MLAKTLSDMEFFVDHGSRWQDGDECVLRFGNDTVCISPHHFKTPEDDSSERHLFKKSIRRVAIEIFSYCNRRCWFCPNASGERRKHQNYLDEAIFLSVMNELASIDYDNDLMFHLYNEPLADRVVIKRLGQAKALVPEAILHIVTNGDYLDRKYLEELADAGAQRIDVCIYDPDNGVFVEEYVLRAIRTMARKLDLANEVEVNQRESILEVQGSYHSSRIRIFARDLNRLGFDRGGLVDIENRPKRTSPCLAPFIDLDIDWHGNFLPCCNIYCDDQRHKEYATGNLHDGRTIFKHYTDEKMVAWRKRLFRFHPEVLPCLTCSRKEFPALCTDANVQEFERLLKGFTLAQPCNIRTEAI